MTIIRTTALAAVLAFGTVAAPAFAQNVNANNLVNVNVSNVANDLAKDLDVNVSDIPVTVQVPVGVAANVCDVDANVLAQGATGGQASECEASSTSQALSQVVQRSMKSQ